MGNLCQPATDSRTRAPRAPAGTRLRAPSERLRALSAGSFLFSAPGDTTDSQQSDSQGGEPSSTREARTDDDQPQPPTLNTPARKLKAKEAATTRAAARKANQEARDFTPGHKTRADRPILQDDAEGDAAIVWQPPTYTETETQPSLSAAPGTPPRDAAGPDDVEVSLDSPRMANVASTRMTVGRACQNFASPLVDELVGGKPRVAVKTVLTARAFQKGLAK